MVFPTALYVFWSITLLAACFHILVTIFVVLQRYQRNKIYTSSFYLLYIMGSVFDITLIFNNFLFDIQLLDFMFPWLYFHPEFSEILFNISGVCMFALTFIHFGTAINRTWVAFTMMKSTSTMNNLGYWLIWCIPLISVAINGPVFFVHMVDLSDELGYFVYYVDPFIIAYINACGPILITSSSLIGFSLSLLTIWRYRYLFKNLNQNDKTLRRNAYLFFQAFVTLLFELLLASYCGLRAIALIYNLMDLYIFASSYFTYVTTTGSLVNPFALLIICKFVRLDFYEFLWKLIGKSKVSTPVVSLTSNHM